MPSTLCANPACQHTFEIQEDCIGRPVQCSVCELHFTAKPAAIWDYLTEREAEICEHQIDGPTPRTEQRFGEPNSSRFKKLCFHQEESSSAARQLAVHDVHYEAGKEFNSPLEPLNPHLEVVLDDLRSKWNVGSIFRTADCAGWSSIHLCGITPTPLAKGVKRVSLGSEAYRPWHYKAHVMTTIEQRTNAGFTPVALEITSDSECISTFTPPEKMLIVIGNEVAGVSREALAMCSKRVAIPLKGRKASLNAAVAFGIAAFALHDAWNRQYDLSEIKNEP